MKKRLTAIITGILILSGLVFSVSGFGQSQKAMTNKYMKKLPSGNPVNDGKLQKYRMTAVYINRDLYGKFTGKTKVTGDYTRGFTDGFVTWKNVFISGSNSFTDPFPAGTKQEYMENMRYIPSSKMLDKDAFKDFPSTPENVFARNLVWDMLTFDTYAWNFSDSLKLNKPYLIPGMHFKFDMADIGNYEHNNITLCWKGISVMNGELCAVIDFNATDNILELNMPMINSKGTEQYWGTVWVSMKTKNIEQGIMYSGTIQEIEVKGMKDKFLTKTIRELYLDRIQ
jgi:hypothetical protein